MFSLTNEMKVYKPQIPQYAVLHKCGGLSFGPALQIDNGFVYSHYIRSATEGDSGDKAKYNIPKDSNGNSVLTGGKDKYIKEWEVYLVE